MSGGRISSHKQQHARRAGPVLMAPKAAVNGAAPDRLAADVARVLSQATPDERATITRFLLQVAPVRQDAERESAAHGTSIATLVRDGRLDAALATLHEATPTLYQHPDAIRALRQVVERADAEAAALGTADGIGGARGGRTPMAFASAGGRIPIATDGATTIQDMMRRAGSGGTGSGGGNGNMGGGGFPTQDTGERRIGAGGWAGSITGGKDQAQGVADAALLRLWADQVPFCQAAIRARKEQVATAEIDVAPIDVDKPFPKPIQQRLELLLAQPNRYLQNWAEMAGMVTTDLLVLDRGVIELNLDARRQPHELRAKDGATIRIYPDWDGDPKRPRYVYEEPNWGRKQPLLNDELIVLMANAATYRFGWSPMQALKDTIRAIITAYDSADHFVGHKPPLHHFNFPGVSQPSLDAVRNRYESEIAGQREIMMTNADEMQVINLMRSAVENQWMEWQIFNVRIVCMCFQMSPQQLGVTFDINRATADSQQEIFEDSGQVPLFLLWEHYLNSELLAKFAPRYPDGRANLDALNLQIKFPKVTEAQRLGHIAEVAGLLGGGLAGLPFMTLNQALVLLGEEPVDGGNTFYVNTAQGPVPWLPPAGTPGGEPGAAGQLGQSVAVQSGEPGTEENTQVPGDTGNSGPGAPPLDDDGNFGGAGNDGSNAGAAALSAGASGAVSAGDVVSGKGLLVLGDVLRDTRRAGKAWSPTAHPMRRAAQTAADIAGADAALASAQMIAASLAATVAGRVADAMPIPTATTPPVTTGGTPWHTLGRLNATAATAQPATRSKAGAAGKASVHLHAHAEEEAGEKPTLRPLGELPENMALRYPKPHKEVEARQTLRAQAKQVFERAALRDQG